VANACEADIYGDNEILVGSWLKSNPEKRSNIFLATKFAIGPQIDSSPEYCKQACAKSLQRLGTDHIDLYYCHRLDGKTPVEQTVRAMAELKDQGKIKYLGLSECSAESLRRACKVHHIAAVQMEYSPFALEIESEQYNLLKTARELGVAIVAYSPIGRGLLSGAIRSPADFSDDDFRKIVPRYSEENFPKNIKLVDEISKLAKEHNATPTQLTLAWLLAQGDDIIPIPGTTKIARLEENLGALKIKLSKEEEQRIRKLCEEAEVVGGRYPEAMSSALFADTPEEK
jgi:aryl-alcohol dehydrogenase-like predicted oxidoreductase